MGSLSFAFPVHHRARKRSSHMTKQFRFEQLSGDRSAIKGDKRLTATLAIEVNSSSQQFFACASFSLNQDRGIRWSNSHGLVQNPQQRLRVANHVLTSTLTVDGVAKGPGLGLDLYPFEHPSHD